LKQQIYLEDKRTFSVLQINLFFLGNGISILRREGVIKKSSIIKTAIQIKKNPLWI